MTRTLLVVDDSDLNRYLVQRMLESEEIEVLEAESGEEGVEQALLHNPDYIFMDYLLPGIDGVEAITRIRAEQQPPVSKIFILTGGVTEGEEVVFSDCPCDGVWKKPLDKARLLSLLSQEGNVDTNAPSGSATTAPDNSSFLKELKETIHPQLLSLQESENWDGLKSQAMMLMNQATERQIQMLQDWTTDLVRAVGDEAAEQIRRILRQLPRLIKQLEKQG